MKFSKPIFYRFLTFLFLAGSALAVLAQNHHAKRSRVDHLRVKGNREFSQDQYEQWFALRKGDALSESDLNQRCLTALRHLNARGFYFATIDSIFFQYNRDSTLVDVDIHVNEGDRLRIDEIEITGLNGEDDKIIKELRSRPGQIFVPEVLQQDIDFILQHHENSGYPYCKVEILDVSLDHTGTGNDQRIDLHLNVTPGPQVTIDNIEIRGNEQTKDHVILRELRIDRGQVYDQREVDQLQSILTKKGYFKWVNPPKLSWQRNGEGTLIIELEEGNNNRFDGVLGYNPGTANSKGFVTGLIDISFRNLLGTGRQVEVHWERRAENTQQLRFHYVEPWVAGFPLNAGIGFEQLIRDTSYVERKFGLDVQFLFNQNLSFITQVAKRSVSPDSLGAALFGIPPSNSLDLTLGLTYNTLDYPLNPQRGVLYQTSFAWSRKTVSARENEVESTSASFDQKTLAVDFETYLSPFRWQVLAVGLHGRRITSDELEIAITDQFRFGGSRNLRGYREEQFRGSRIAWANLEYRYLMNRNSRAFVFLDTGYFFREELLGETPSKIEAAKIGFGIGLRIDTKLGFFGIDYGLGEGDGLSDGKVHISLRNEF